LTRNIPELGIVADYPHFYANSQGQLKRASARNLVRINSKRNEKTGKKQKEKKSEITIAMITQK
jgi:hypothetical protein